MPPYEMRLCEVEVWDGGEYVYCHQPANHRDGDGFWRCRDHPADARPTVKEDT